MQLKDELKSSETFVYFGRFAFDRSETTESTVPGLAWSLIPPDRRLEGYTSEVDLQTHLSTESDIWNHASERMQRPLLVIRLDKEPKKVITPRRFISAGATVKKPKHMRAVQGWRKLKM